MQLLIRRMDIWDWTKIIIFSDHKAEEGIDIWLVGLVGWVLWHINHCRLFNAKSKYMQIVNSISNNSVSHEYIV